MSFFKAGEHIKRRPQKAIRLVIDSYYRPVAEEIISAMHKGLILDLGTGPGYLPVEIVKKAPEINIIGIDLSRKLIKAARANDHRAGVDRQLTFKVGNSARLQFKDNRFDLVISTEMLHSLKNPNEKMNTQPYRDRSLAFSQ